MTLSGKAADKIIFFILYSGIIIFVVLSGVKIINYSLETKFYSDFAAKWEISIKSYNSRGGTWPAFNGSNHVEYMDNLIRLMRKKNITVPESNTLRPYIKRIDKIGLSNKKEDIFFLCFNNRIVIYGISKDTFKRLDTLIDGRFDPAHGKFTGYPGKNRKTYISNWQL